MIYLYIEGGDYMSNYVYNRVLCNLKAKELLEDKDYCFNQQEERFLNKYDYISKKIDDDTYELKFDTRGINYYDKEIREIITKFNDTHWFCVEENMCEEGHYYYKDEKIILDIRDLHQNSIKDNQLLFTVECYDTIFNWWHYCLFIYKNLKNNVIVEDLDLNKKLTFKINPSDIKIIEEISRNFVSNFENEACYFPAKDNNFQEELAFFMYDETGYKYEIISSHKKGDYYNKYFKDLTYYMLEVKHTINKILINNGIPRKYLIKGNYKKIEDIKRDRLERLLSSTLSLEQTEYVLSLIDNNLDFDYQRFLNYLQSSSSKNKDDIIKEVENYENINNKSTS